MSRIIETLTTIYPDQVWLEILPEHLERTWSKEQEYSYDVARRTAFINCLTLNAFLDWFKAESGLDEQLQVWPSPDALPSIWEVVNGTALQLGGTRIVLIPSEENDTNEFSVQAEWIDIPNWAGDYYLAMQVNPDDCWLRIWGYATHKKLKQAGQYDEIRRVYTLEREDLIEDLNVMWVAREFSGDCQEAVEPLPTLSAAQAKNLLAQLSQPSSYSPRLRVDFAQWRALLMNATWRQQLYKLRLVKPANLSQWFQSLFEEGWEAVENVLATPKWVIKALPTHESHSSNSQAIAAIIPLLQPDNDELTRRQAAGVLGKIGVGNSQVIEALIKLLQTAQTEETRWQATISLGKVDPNNPKAGRQKAKLIDLGVQLGGDEIALIVTIIPNEDGTISVVLQVRPKNEQTYLRPHLKLSVLTESGESMEVEARSNAKGQGNDKLIQIWLIGLPGEHFQVSIILNNGNFIENFVI